MGLRYDDLIVEENMQMQKVRVFDFFCARMARVVHGQKTNMMQALSRLPANETYDRVYRMRRAVQCSIIQRDLPKEQWTTPQNVCTMCSSYSNKAGQALRYAAPQGGSGR